MKILMKMDFYISLWFLLVYFCSKMAFFARK